MKPVIDHIQITVKDLKIAEHFYDKFLPIIGFDLNRKSKGKVPKHDIEVVEYFHPATSQQEVDDLYLKIKETGANIIEPPKLYPQHGENYYALFFKDPDGIKYEIVYEDR